MITDSSGVLQFRIAGYLPIGADFRALGPVVPFNSTGSVPADDTVAKLRADLDQFRFALDNWKAAQGIAPIPDQSGVKFSHLAGLARVAASINYSIRRSHPDLAPRTVQPFSAPRSSAAIAPRGRARVAAAINADLFARGLVTSLNATH